jgi:hypothetical protein
VYNLISDSERELYIEVKDTNIPSLEEKLGIRYKAEEHECSIEKIMRVVSVQENSPGEDADLKPKTDFIITSLNIDYYDVDHFANLVGELYSKLPEASIKLVVYNILHEEMRIVVIKPSNSWGGGLLGVEFGQGLQNNFRDLQTAFNEFRSKEIEKLGSGTIKESPLFKRNVSIDNITSPALRNKMSQEEFLNQVLSPVSNK